MVPIEKFEGIGWGGYKSRRAGMGQANSGLSAQVKGQ